MKVHGHYLLTLAILPVSAYATAINVNLGTADPFAVLAGSTVTNTGPSIVSGDLGVSPGSAINGFPPGTVTGTIHNTDAVAMQAQNDLTTAYNFAAGESCGTNLTGQNLGGLTLTPGVYCFMSSAQLTGALTLNSQGNSNAVFVFQIGSTLTTASASSVLFSNGGEGDNVFWQVGSSAVLGTTTEFAGNILALTSISLDTSANIGCGRALARNGAVTMDTNDVSINTVGCETTGGPSPVPEPSTASLLLLIGPPSLLWLRKLKSARR
jgi:ice-binding like protein